MVDYNEIYNLTKPEKKKSTRRAGKKKPSEDAAVKAEKKTTEPKTGDKEVVKEVKKAGKKED